MSLPDRAAALALDQGFLGRPFVRVSADAEAPPPDIGVLGEPFVAAPGAEAPPDPPSTARRRRLFLGS